jgi:hypothetical protein
MTLEVVVVVEGEVILVHVLEAGLVNALEVVLKIVAVAAGLKASHGTGQEVVPSLQQGVTQGHLRQEIETL